MESSHLIYQNNGSYVEFYKVYHENKMCASSSSATRVLSPIITTAMVLFKLVPWCLICILNVIMILKIRQNQQWGKDNRPNTQVRFHMGMRQAPFYRGVHTAQWKPVDFFFFFNCMFYQLLHVQHSCSSTQSRGSVLPSIVETRDQNSRGCPLLFSNRNLGSFCA